MIVLNRPVLIVHDLLRAFKTGMFALVFSVKPYGISNGKYQASDMEPLEVIVLQRVSCFNVILYV